MLSLADADADADEYEDADEDEYEDADEDEDEDEEPSPKGGFGAALGLVFGSTFVNLEAPPRCCRMYSSRTILLEYQSGPA